MGATSVTGVGPGSVEGLDRGSERMTLAVGNLLGPKVVRAGSVTLVGGAGTVSFGKLDGSASDYVVFLQDSTAAAAATYSALTTSGFTVAGTGTHVINYMVVEAGQAAKTVA